MWSVSKLFFVQICGSIMVLLALAGCSREPERSPLPPPPVKVEILQSTTLLATVGAGEKLADAGVSSGHGMMTKLIFSEQGRGVAYIREEGGLFRAVHNGKADKAYKAIDFMALSPDGRRLAYTAQINGKWCMVVDGKEGKAYEAVGFPKFSPDSRHIAYDVQIGEQRHLIVDDTMSAGFPSVYTVMFSYDSTKIIFIENSTMESGPYRVVVSDLAFKKQQVKELRAAGIVFNRDKTRLAAIAEAKGKQRLVEFRIDPPDVVREGPLFDAVGLQTFGPDGVSVAYVAENGGKRFLVLDGKEELLPDADLPGPPAVRPDLKAAGIILAMKDGFVFHQTFIRDGANRKHYQEAGQPLYSRDGSRYAYIAKQDKRVFMVVNDTEGPAFDMVVTPVFSPDGKFLVYRARKDGKRFVVVADADGKVISQHTGYEQVFQPVFTPDGKSVAYGVKDGQKLVWKVEKVQG